mgnify:CR=1 FL=1
MSSNLDAYKTAFGKYATFEGRATVREYWSFYLINTAVGLLLAFVPALYVVFFIGIFLPSLAVGIRRLHDQNRSGWYWLIAFIPLGVLVLLYWATQRGTEGSNDYGPDPTRQSGGQAPRPPNAQSAQSASKASPAASSDSPPTQASRRYCTYSDCGKEVSPTAEFCAYCGRPIAKPS